MAARQNRSKQNEEYKYRACWIGTAVLICCAGIAFAFRSGEPQRKLGVQGKIVLDGKPLERAVIVFIPISIEGARQSGSVVMNGEYQVEEEVGLMPGRYRVEFHPYISPFDSGASSRAGQPLPEWYAVQPQLEIEVKETERKYDFSLKTRGSPESTRL